MLGIFKIDYSMFMYEGAMTSELWPGRFGIVVYELLDLVLVVTILLGKYAV